MCFGCIAGVGGAADVVGVAVGIAVVPMLLVSLPVSLLWLRAFVRRLGALVLVCMVILRLSYGPVLLSCWCWWYAE